MWLVHFYVVFQSLVIYKSSAFPSFMCGSSEYICYHLTCSLYSIGNLKSLQWLYECDYLISSEKNSGKERYGILIHSL